MIISLTTQLSVYRKPALTPLTFRNITIGQGAPCLLSTAGTAGQNVVNFNLHITTCNTKAGCFGTAGYKGCNGPIRQFKVGNQGEAGGKLVHEKLSITCRAGGACPGLQQQQQAVAQGAHTIIRRVSSSSYLLCTKWYR